jgi:cardiolipin synthase
MFVLLIINGSRISVLIEYGLTIVSILVALYIVGESANGAYKLIWIMLILSFPIFGGSLYIFFNYQASMKQFQEDFKRANEKCRDLFRWPGDYYKDACEKLPENRTQIQYLQRFAGFPVYGRTDAKYLTPGEVKFEAIIEALKKAEKYIFLEYFSIHAGIMWNTILEILKQKAAAGVDVRIIYDDVGCLLLLPKDYTTRLEKMGIKGVVFNPMRPILLAKQNNRDHRKIAVIDGKIAITGGINIADEYINALDKYGHWKDAAVQVEGEAAWSFTLMFLQIWSVCTKTDEDFSLFYPQPNGPAPPENRNAGGEGFVQPYADSPLDNERISENVYMQVICSAKDYIYINTPYLVLDENMLSALSLAAKSGVDVRIVTPQRPDKKYVHMVTKSYYLELIRAGVKVYEYIDGFIHAKTFVSDDNVATVGTANLDYRSLYLCFECGVCLYKKAIVKEIHGDFINTLKRCRLITERECNGRRFHTLFQGLMRFLAPLL